MTSKRFLASFVIFSVVTLFGCDEKNQESNNQTYEDILSELDSQTGQGELLELISIEKILFNIESENEMERRMNFDFIMKNLSDDTMKISYVGYFPEELESYYLSRSKIELQQVDLKPNQVINATQSMLVAHEKMLTAKQSKFLQEVGHVMYFAISIDGKFKYVKVKLDELGFQQ